MSMDDIFVRLGPLPVRLSSDDAEFLGYAGSHFEPVTAGPSERPGVEATFTRGACEEEKRARAGYERIGRGIFSNGRVVLWNSVPYFPGLTMTFRLEDGTLAVDAWHDPPSSMTGTAKRFVKAIYGRAEGKSVFFFELLYYLAYYPAFRMLLDRGIYPLHGGGIEARGRRIVVAGAQGTGKSTLISNLLLESGSRFLSDNIILFDRGKVYSCHEPLRLDTEMLGSKPRLQEMIGRIDLDVPLGRTAGNVSREKYLESMEPEIFMIPRISRSATSLTPCTAEEFIRKSIYFNSLADEVRSFDIFASVVGQAFPPEAPPCGAAETLGSLIEGRKVYDLGIGYGEDPAETARIFMESLNDE
jgi:hypothetical protein